MENSMEVPQKTKNRVTICSSNPTLGHIPRQNFISKIHAPLCSQQHCLQQPIHGSNLNIYRQMSGWRRYGINVSHEKEWNNAMCSNMAGPRDDHTKKMRQRKTNIMWYHLYKKMVQMNLFTKQKWTHRYGGQACSYQRVQWKEEVWEFGIGICLVLYMGGWAAGACSVAQGAMLRVLW